LLYELIENFSRYSPIYDKGFIDANYDCYPYGYRGDPIIDPTK